MGGLALKPIPFKSLPAPFLRLTPTIFEYARLTADEGAGLAPEVEYHFASHLQVLQDYLGAVAKTGELAPRFVFPLVHRCEILVDLHGRELGLMFADLVGAMQTLYAVNRPLFKGMIADTPELFRDLYRAEIDPTRILAVYAEETWDRSEKMGARLTDRCWYDHRRQCEGKGMVWLDGIDVVLLAPGKQPIHPRIRDAIADAQIPVVVLAGWSRQEDPAAMAELRTEFWYRRSGARVLHGPFTPVRLYQAIDKLHLQNLARMYATGLRVISAAG